MDIEKFKNIDKISSKLICDKRCEYEFKIIRPEQLFDYQSKGWELETSRLKKSLRIKRLKQHGVAFEDRVWALFAQMKFTYLNGSNIFKIEYQVGLKKQIDVVAVDGEVVLVVECKSCHERRRVNYQKDINELIGIKEKIRRAAKETFGRNMKVAFIFATNNAIIGKNDKLRLSQEKIIHFNQDDIEYFETLTSHLGSTAKYQLFGKLFAGQKIPNLKTRIPAIKGKVPPGYTFYSFSIDPKELLKVAYILHRTETDPEAANAYQRLIKKSRLKQISNFIDKGGYFPNSVIVNIQTTSNRELKFEQASLIEHDSSTAMGILHLPQCYKSAFIIDGQHRLLSYGTVFSQSHHTMPVVAFHNLPVEEQSKLFIDINHTQKSVPANLLQSIMADFNWKSKNEKSAIAALKTRMFVEMNSDEGSPFYKRIILSEERKSNSRCLTLQTILLWGFSGTNYFGSLKGDKIIKTGYLHEVDYDKMLLKCQLFFNKCFELFEEKLCEQWKIGSGEGGFIAMNIGVSSVLRVIDDILEYLVKFKNIEPQQLDGELLAEEVLIYLKPVVEFVKCLDKEGISKLRSLFGSGAPEKVSREYQNAIHSYYEDFKPDGLVEWIEASTGKYTKLAYDVGHDQIEPLVDRFIKQKLLESLGKKYWWIHGIPKDIQADCSNKKIYEESTEPECNFLNTIHYVKIIEHNWQILGNYFTPPGLEQSGKKKRIEWMSKFNKIRQKYSHPQREDVTEEEFNFLENLYNWLTEKVK